MLDIKFIRENLELVKKSAESKNGKVDFNEILRLDDLHRKHLTELEQLRSERNKANDQIGVKKAKKEDVSQEIASMKAISQKIHELDKIVGDIDYDLRKLLLYIPNVADKDVPIGADPKQNKVIKEWGTPKKFDFKPKNHLELGEKLGLDMKRGAKVAGSGFYNMTGHAARLERALINLMVGYHAKNGGYIEVSPPLTVNRETMTGTGQLPKLEEDMYKLEQEDFFLIPTAEVPVTNLHRDETLKEEVLPIKYVAYTPCFRREAGSYGKDTKGLSRVHQFDKVELVKIVKPEDTEKEHEQLLKDAENILQLLELPYRVVLLCTGDLSFAGAKCYDLEVWAPGQNAWLEVSSCSHFTDFQARRMNIKFKRKSGGKPELVHTMNASGVALPRLVIALWENFQDKDGNIHYPKVLQEYLEKF
jgi:seryl-tRNA synthetase